MTIYNFKAFSADIHTFRIMKSGHKTSCQLDSSRQSLTIEMPLKTVTYQLAGNLKNADLEKLDKSLLIYSNKNSIYENPIVLLPLTSDKETEKDENMSNFILKTAQTPEIEVDTHKIGNQKFLMPKGMSLFKVGDTFVGLENHHVEYIEKNFGSLNSLEGDNLKKAIEFIQSSNS